MWDERKNPDWAPKIFKIQKINTNLENIDQAVRESDVNYKITRRKKNYEVNFKW